MTQLRNGARQGSKQEESARLVTAADAPKVELFSRTPREGWAPWGNEAESGGAP